MIIFRDVGFSVADIVRGMQQLRYGPRIAHEHPPRDAFPMNATIEHLPSLRTYSAQYAGCICGIHMAGYSIFGKTFPIDPRDWGTVELIQQPNWYGSE